MTSLCEVYGPAPLAARALRRFGAWTIERDLKHAFRRVVWLGDEPALPTDRPVVMVSNHHVYHDSFLLWWHIVRRLGRPFVVWMEAWDTAPLFGPLGALPFSADDPRERMRTMRETARRMRDDPRTVLLLFPEGTMRPPDAGLGSFAADLPRLARVLPAEVVWLPVGVRQTGWGQSLPTALLAAGTPADSPDGANPDHLAAVLSRLHDACPADLAEGRAHVLLDGTPGPDERWDLSRLAPLFRRIGRRKGV